ncbi:hypothetical protein [Nocardia testacea]|uniref:Uncharacterized protein n=1 Tax=Nocardia testacea TaxID=248551 RepID=A0ABW7VPU1_9NOCA
MVEQPEAVSLWARPRVMRSRPARPAGTARPARPWLYGTVLRARARLGGGDARTGADQREGNAARYRCFRQLRFRESHE